MVKKKIFYNNEYHILDMFKSKNKLKSTKKFLIIFIILIITLKLSFLIDKSLKKPSSDFEYLIKKNDYLNFTVNYDILLHGGYKDPSVKVPDGRVTLQHVELEKKTQEFFKTEYTSTKFRMEKKLPGK